MRITGGRAKGRILTSFKGLNIRPSSDRVREAVFSVIGQELPGLRVLDLFAGTGSLGLEALSRGAQYTLFIERSTSAINLIRKNLRLCGFSDSVNILKADLGRGIPSTNPLLKDCFDLVFIDPPYESEYTRIILGELSKREILSLGASVIVESAKTELPADAFGNLRVVNDRYYGDTKISIYKYGYKQ
jgi:16S rRNA (guanine966-N2)-methyltransferase